MYCLFTIIIETDIYKTVLCTSVPLSIQCFTSCYPETILGECKQ